LLTLARHIFNPSLLEVLVAEAAVASDVFDVLGLLTDEVVELASVADVDVFSDVDKLEPVDAGVGSAFASALKRWNASREPPILLG
jgi:hypothetical protein